MTPSMYVVCSAHICQGLRGWAGAEGGDGWYWKHKEDGGEKQGERVCVCVCACVCFFRTPAATEKPNTPYLLWKN